MFSLASRHVALCPALQELNVTAIRVWRSFFLLPGEIYFNVHSATYFMSWGATSVGAWGWPLEVAERNKRLSFSAKKDIAELELHAMLEFDDYQVFA